MSAHARSGALLVAESSVMVLLVLDAAASSVGYLPVGTVTVVIGRARSGLLLCHTRFGRVMVNRENLKCFRRLWVPPSEGA